jgi:hypothetical protein
MEIREHPPNQCRPPAPGGFPGGDQLLPNLKQSWIMNDSHGPDEIG